MLKFTSMEHIALAVHDTDAEAEWYRDILGFSIVYKAPTSPRNYFVRDPAGASMIEIMPLRDPDQLDHNQTNPAHFHIALGVDDIDEAKAALEALGVDVGAVSALPGGAKSAFFRDPEGIPLQLIYRRERF